ncbi:MAG: hypothetical protein AABZ39_13570 [Spirochaetota bacterium]
MGQCGTGGHCRLKRRFFRRKNVFFLQDHPRPHNYLCTTRIGRDSIKIDASIIDYIASREKDFDTSWSLPGMPFKSPGYHSKVPDGAYAHPTRDALMYAYLLLASGVPSYRTRAVKVVRAVLALQDTDPTSKTYGIWPWLAEEPLTKMSPPDWNWADFIGAALLMIYHDHRTRLPKALVSGMRASITHAAYSIFRRNIRSDYTNIAIMGAGVTLAAGEMFDLPDMFAYGKKRLRDLISHTEHHGGFNEYNSPTYTIVAVEELNRIRHLVKDASIRALVRTLHLHAWTMIAEHWHPATMQWSGPHSRAYADTLSPETLDLLARSGAISFTPSRTIPPRVVPCYPLPAVLKERFASLPKKEFSIRRRFIRHDDDSRSVYGTTWFSPEATIGSSNHDFCWTQRRTLIGYWKNGDGVAVLRLRFLHNGRDFSTGHIVSTQHDNRILSIAGVFRNNGDFHPSLDKPANNIFRASDLRLRFELTADGAEAGAVGSVFSLSAGMHKARIHTSAGKFHGAGVSWTANGMNAIDCILYSGTEKEFLFTAEEEYYIPLGVELTPSDAPATDVPVSAECADGICRAAWDGLAAEASIRPY